MERMSRYEIVFPAEVLPLEPNSHYRLKIDENVVKNEAWSKMKWTERLEVVIHTKDDHCKYVEVAPSLGNKMEVLCQYVEARCFCQQIFIWIVCSKNLLNGEKSKE